MNQYSGSDDRERIHTAPFRNMSENELYSHNSKSNWSLFKHLNELETNFFKTINHWKSLSFYNSSQVVERKIFQNVNNLCDEIFQDIQNLNVLLYECSINPNNTYTDVNKGNHNQEFNDFNIADVLELIKKEVDENINIEMDTFDKYSEKIILYIFDFNLILYKNFLKEYLKEEFYRNEFKELLGEGFINDFEIIWDLMEEYKQEFSGDFFETIYESPVEGFNFIPYISQAEDNFRNESVIIYDEKTYFMYLIMMLITQIRHNLWNIILSYNF